MTEAAKAGARHSAADNQLLKDSRQKLREIDANLVALGTPEDDPAPEGEAPAEANALKAISSTDTELRVGNYIVLFGGQDLTGEYFTPETVLESEHTALGKLDIDWEHGQQAKTDGLGTADVLGYVDWKTAKADSRGVWVERVLNRRQKYVEWLQPLIEAGLVGTSSQAVAARVRKAAGGEIQVWPLYRDALTVQPAEPRMLGENVIAAMKALGISAGPGQAASDGAPAAKSSVNATGDYEMDEKELKSLQDGFAALTASNEALKKQNEELVTELRKPALKALAAVEPVPDDPKPFKSLGEQLYAELKRAHTGQVDPRQEKYNARISAALKASGMNEGTLADGGAMVQTEFSNALLQRPYAEGQLLSRVSQQPIGAGFNGYNALLIDETSRADGSRSGAVAMYWTAEAGSYTASRPKLRRFPLALDKLTGLVYATDENLQDATQLEGLIQREYPREFDFKANDAIINGTGTGMPQGILAAPATVSVAKESGQAAATVVYQNLVKMWARLHIASRGNAVWLINQDVEPQLDMLVLASGTAAIPPRFVDYGPDGVMRIKGRPVVVLEQCQTLGTVGDIILADPSQFMWIKKGGLDAASSIHVLFTTGEQTFRFTARCNGAPMWNAALTPKNGSNTLSPFVTLATRS